MTCRRYSLRDIARSITSATGEHGKDSERAASPHAVWIIDVHPMAGGAGCRRATSPGLNASLSARRSLSAWCIALRLSRAGRCTRCIDADKATWRCSAPGKKRTVTANRRVPAPRDTWARIASSPSQRVGAPRHLRQRSSMNRAFHRYAFRSTALSSSSISSDFGSCPISSSSTTKPLPAR